MLLPRMPIAVRESVPKAAYLPVIHCAITDVVAGIIVVKIQPVYPIQVIAFQLIMFGLALLFALPVRWLWVFSFVLLIVGVWVTGFSIGLHYVPTVIASGWVMAKRLETNSAGV